MRCLLLLCLAFVAVGCANSPSQDAGQTVAVANIERSPIENFGVVDADLWRGSAPDIAGYRWLYDAGAKTIIDLQTDDLSARIPQGIEYVHLPTSAWHADEVDIQKVVAAIREHPKPVYIHCAQGRDRTGLAVAGYRLSKDVRLEDVLKDLDQYHINWWWRAPIRQRLGSLADNQFEKVQ